MKTKFTCATCKDSKCQIRQSCPDDETTQQKRPKTVYQIGEITL